ncbi:glycerophosphodiester phosphodiesterase [Pseudomonadota bacterium]
MNAQSRSILSIGHRGGGGQQRENTLEAFLYAVEQGCEAIEMDLRFDRFRNHFYLEHDFVHSRKIKNNTIDKVIPRLPNELQLIIEFKTNAVRSYIKHFKEEYSKYFEDRKIVVISYNPVVLHRLKKVLPNVERGYLCGNPISFWFFRAFFEKYVRPTYLFVHKRMVGKKIMNYANGKKYRTVAYVLNKEKNWQRALDLGVDGIITDNPTSFSEFLQRK